MRVGPGETPLTLILGARKIDKLLVGLEEIKKDSQRLTDESVALIHKEYKKALGEFKDIKELDIQSYLNKIDE